ncbi:hypothetical protein DPMN_140246 [Dreissena polymorpha]|uniref:Uncharacterized protein n=1 Tax=Dreissena polymorpha TaxID=45954 RepID=A0A9D4G7B6_DREPO|nr:hypothetical protein DPMN_140246 [Dreissena polymorpha]
MGKKSFERHVKCMGITLHNAKVLDDNGPWSIVAICGLPDGRILVADNANTRVKLFDQDSKLVSHCNVYEYIYDICQINCCDVAITQEDYNTNRHELQFISLQNSKLVKTRTLRLTHVFHGVAHNRGNLYVTTRTALMIYTLRGTFLRKLYEDKGNCLKVWKCAVSPSGDRTYIVNPDHHRLITLSRDGTVFCTFTVNELESPIAVHATTSGQLLVVGINSVLQVDSEGKRTLVILATERVGAKRPQSVFYNSAKSSILIGQYNYSKLLELKVDLMKVPC